jgi:hypothetical protein
VPHLRLPAILLAALISHAAGLRAVGKPLRKAGSMPQHGLTDGPRSRLVAQIGPNRAISGRILTLLAGSETRRIWHQ